MTAASIFATLTESDVVQIERWVEAWKTAPEGCLEAIGDGVSRYVDQNTNQPSSHDYLQIDKEAAALFPQLIGINGNDILDLVTKRHDAAIAEYFAALFDTFNDRHAELVDRIARFEKAIRSEIKKITKTARHLERNIDRLELPSGPPVRTAPRQSMSLDTSSVASPRNAVSRRRNFL